MWLAGPTIHQLFSVATSAVRTAIHLRGVELPEFGSWRKLPHALGFLADFLSRTVLIGLLTGVGIQVGANRRHAGPKGRRPRHTGEGLERTAAAR